MAELAMLASDSGRLTHKVIIRPASSGRDQRSTHSDTPPTKSLVMLSDNVYEPPSVARGDIFRQSEVL